MAKLSKDEKANQDFIDLAFGQHTSGNSRGSANWIKTAERLNRAIKGQYSLNIGSP